MPCPILDIPKGLSRPEVPLSQFDIRGLDHLQRAMDNGKGAILWESSHFGRRLLAKRILRHKGFVVDQVDCE